MYSKVQKQSSRKLMYGRKDGYYLKAKIKIKPETEETLFQKIIKKFKQRKTC